MNSFSIVQTFLAKKYKAKRFGLDGGESMIPGLKALVNTVAQQVGFLVFITFAKLINGCKGVEAVVMGMPHRGRLNVLCNVLDKPLSQLFNEFRMGEEVIEERHLMITLVTDFFSA